MDDVTVEFIYAEEVCEVDATRFISLFVSLHYYYY
jgi:hypothetical protein